MKRQCKSGTFYLKMAVRK